ncbi:MAG: hypothetical protein Fur007_13600 [Rhodoferax sp.]
MATQTPHTPAPNAIRRSHAAVSVLEAGQSHSTLAGLIARGQASSARLHCVLPLVPPGLRTSIKAGPLTDGVWCLLLANAACSAKMRQLLPALQAHLNTHGLPVSAIRLKVESGHTG